MMNPIKSTEAKLDVLGQAAYDAYCEKRDWKSFDGKPLPRWPEVKPEIKEGWVQAANGVIEALNRHCARCFEPVHVPPQDWRPALVHHSLCASCGAHFDGAD